MDYGDIMVLCDKIDEGIHNKVPEVNGNTLLRLTQGVREVLNSLQEENHNLTINNSHITGLLSGICLYQEGGVVVVERDSYNFALDSSNSLLQVIDEDGDFHLTVVFK